MQLRKGVFIGIIVTLAVFLGVNIFQFLFWGNRLKSTEAKYIAQVNKLQTTLNKIGPIKTVYTVSKDVEPGKKIALEDLKQIDAPQTMVGKGFIEDPTKIVGQLFKIHLTPGTPITSDTVMGEDITNSIRQYELVLNNVPMACKVGDFVDVRIVLPTGTDYIALSHKRVQGIQGKVVSIYASEDEIHTYQSMLIDYFLNDGTSMYATKYIEPGVQEAAKVYYAPRTNIVAVMLADPNIQQVIEAAVLKNKRDGLDLALKDMSSEMKAKLSTGRTGNINNLDAASQSYKQQQDSAAAEAKKNSTLPTAPAVAQPQPQAGGTTTGSTTQVPTPSSGVTNPVNSNGSLNIERGITQ